VRTFQLARITTRYGELRVLNGKIGMVFPVDKFTNGVAGPVAHVRDYRYPGDHRDYQIWSIAADSYELINT